MNHLKKTALAIALPFGLMTVGPASAADWQEFVGCCLSPNPIKCLSELSATAQYKDGEQIKALTARMTKLAKAGAFDEARKSKGALGLKHGPYSSSCSPEKTLDLFENRVPLAKIQAECNVKSAADL
jgi:hypothetical protein